MPPGSAPEEPAAPRSSASRCRQLRKTSTTRKKSTPYFGNRKSTLLQLLDMYWNTSTKHFLCWTCGGIWAKNIGKKGRKSKGPTQKRRDNNRWHKAHGMKATYVEFGVATSSSLLLVVRVLLVAMPGAPSILAPSGQASTSSFLLLVVVVVASTLHSDGLHPVVACSHRLKVGSTTVGRQVHHCQCGDLQPVEGLPHLTTVFTHRSSERVTGRVGRPPGKAHTTDHKR